MELIYGAVVPLEFFGAAPGKQRYGSDKPTLDLCFVAYKYMPLGRDKGYDTLQLGKRLDLLRQLIRN